MRLLEMLRVVELESTPAVGYAGRVLVEMGASVTLVGAPSGGPTSELPPFVDGRSATEAYLNAGKDRRSAGTPAAELLEDAALVLVGGHAVPPAWQEHIDASPLPSAGRAIVHCTPYGLTGPKSAWQGAELTLFQAGGEGSLQPSGLAQEEAPESPPLGVVRYSAHYSAGLTAALAGVAALRTSRRSGLVEVVDISTQDVQLSLSYLTVSRYVDGFLETRENRSLRYGGVLRCADGYVEMIPIEEHQWLAVRDMLGDPEWARDERFATGAARSEHGAEITAHLRQWAIGRTVDEVVVAATEHHVPCGRFAAPGELAAGPQLRARGFFRPWEDAGRLADQFPGVAWRIDRDPVDGRAEAR